MRIEYSPRFDQLAVRKEDVVAAPGLGDCRDSPAIAFRDRGTRRFDEPLVRGWRNLVIQERLRRVDKNPGKLTGRVAQQPSPVGVSRGVVKAGHLHRARICQEGMSVDARQRDRPIRNRGAECGMRRKGRAAPTILVPTSADDPLLAGVACKRDGGCDDLFKRARVGKVYAVECEAEVGKVKVRVHETRQHGGLACVEHIRGGPTLRHRAGGRTDVFEAPRTYRKRFRCRRLVVDRMDGTPKNDEIRRFAYHAQPIRRKAFRALKVNIDFKPSAC